MLFDYYSRDMKRDQIRVFGFLKIMEVDVTQFAFLPSAAWILPHNLNYCNLC
jgi:hypothetical protein